MAVRSLFSRCGLVSADNSMINDMVHEEPPTKPIVSRASSLTTSLSCTSPSRRYLPDETDDISSILEKTVPDLLQCISSPFPQDRKAYKQHKNKKSEAFQKLHDMTKKGHEHNRAPLVASNKWNVIKVLSLALLDIQQHNDTDETKDKLEMNQDRRLICWTLNNLSIPYENKAIMAKGDDAPLLFHALTCVIQANLPSSYLCIICFMNLTFLAEAIEPVTYYVVPNERDEKKLEKSSTSRSSPLRVRTRSVGGVTSQSSENGTISQKSLRILQNNKSLLRSLERMMLTNSPFLLSTVTSVQGEAIRWTCGLIRNITFAKTDGDSHDCLSGSTGRQGVIDNSKIEEICTLISQTEIPRLIVTYVRDSPNPEVKWTKDSLEDICLGVICQLAQWPSSRDALKRAGAAQSLEKVEGLPGIHGYRARAIRCSLGTLPVQYG